MTVSKFWCLGLFLVESGVKVDGRYYQDALLRQKKTLPAVRQIAGSTYKTVHPPTALQSATQTETTTD